MPTSGPSTAPGGFINLGVAAHITAASAGGPRFDPTLTAAERAHAINGIWLCQTCAKLVDSDLTQFTVEVLERWKRDAEAATQLGRRVETASGGTEVALHIPSFSSADKLFSFAHRAIPHLGRGLELSELKAFLDAPASFSWWMWTGPAGVGKSRLALEACLATEEHWHAGFLSEGEEGRAADWSFERPTLIVVDYAASRGQWLGETILRFARAGPSGGLIRMLILERRADGDWWTKLQRLHRHAESIEIAASSYALPRAVGRLRDDDLALVIEATARYLGRELSVADGEDILDHARAMDDLGRPLFAVIATADWIEGRGTRGTRDEVLSEILTRSDAQAASTGTPALSLRSRGNLLALTTSVGGMSFDELVDACADRVATSVIPDPKSGEFGEPIDALLEGVQPDVLGEFFVLERLLGQDPDRYSTRSLLQVAWDFKSEAYCAFVERAATDFPEHPRLGDLLHVSTGGSDGIARWARLVANVFTLLARSDHPMVEPVLRRIADAAEQVPTDDVRKGLAEVRFQFANLVFYEGDNARARQLFSRALDGTDPSWPVVAWVLNNRGITWRTENESEAAMADYSTVIESEGASDEAKACSLNNRADLYDELLDYSRAIADRSAVIALDETSYNRRYIAHHRRARAYRASGNTSAALVDVGTILATPDIAIEQKMSARLLRAEILWEEGDYVLALDDVTTILNSHRNFDEVRARAGELRIGLQASADPAG